MERWAIKNRTAGTLEVGCLHRPPLGSLERFEFDGECPDELKWYVGTKQAYLFALAPKAPSAPRPATPAVTPVAADASPAKPAKSAKP